MQDNLVSIITPMYNASRFVAQTIESVLVQTYPHWEMLVINDGSKDNSAEIVEGYIKRDNRIKLFHQENSGTAAARNNSIRRANGRYIALLDADDLWKPMFLESQLNLLKKTNGLLVYASFNWVDENNLECSPPYIVEGQIGYKDLLKRTLIMSSTGIYDTSVFGKIYFKEELKSLRDDYTYWLEIIKKAKFAYANSEILASYRIVCNSVTRNKKKLIIPQFNIYYKVEKLGLFRSLYYLCNWAVYGFLKHRKIRSK